MQHFQQYHHFTNNATIIKLEKPSVVLRIEVAYIFTIKYNRNTCNIVAENLTLVLKKRFLSSLLQILAEIKSVTLAIYIIIHKHYIQNFM